MLDRIIRKRFVGNAPNQSLAPVAVQCNPAALGIMLHVQRRQQTTLEAKG
jgi:hypothetical protein